MTQNTKIIEIPVFFDSKYGSLAVLESLRSVPFEVRRVYYIYGVPEDETRGHHSHNELEQVLICIKGSVTVSTSTIGDKNDHFLDNPSKGLYIGPMVWRVMKDFSEDAVLLVLASEYFIESDYIRCHDQYIDKAKKFFQK